MKIQRYKNKYQFFDFCKEKLRFKISKMMNLINKNENFQS